MVELETGEDLLVPHTAARVLVDDRDDALVDVDVHRDGTGGVHRHGGNEPARLEDRHAHDRPDRGLLIRRPVRVVDPCIVLAVHDHERLAGTHRFEARGAELPEGVSADDAVRA